jgi:hypothetical protein
MGERKGVGGNGGGGGRGEGGRNDPNIVCTYELKKKEISMEAHQKKKKKTLSIAISNGPGA